MGALNPLFLLAGISIGVPIFLHLFQRHQTRRLSFPALRYLERTEREHARKIRLRQLLLLLARVAVLLLLVGAGARLVFGGRGASHPPTAVAIVLDNSLSSGLVVGEARVLDHLKNLAEQTLDRATDADRFWVIRAGEPWLPAIPGGAIEARAAVRDTEVSAAAGDLTAALERAAALLENTDLSEREIHLLSDLQASAFAAAGAARTGAIPTVAWVPTDDEASNRALTGIVVGGGLPPLEGQRTEVTVTAYGPPGDSTRIPVRVIVNERIRGAATVPPGSEAAIALPPAGTGWIRGYADADPDELRADDRRFFAYRSRPAPTVAVAGESSLFVAEAIAVLADAGRLRSAPPTAADLIVAHGADGLALRTAGGSAVVLPPSDPTLLPALNRRLADAGIPWSYAARQGSGEAPLEGRVLPDPLAGVIARGWFTIASTGDSPTPTRSLAEVAGDPWALEGTDSEGRRYLLVASSLEDASTTLPVSTSMLRFVDWIASEWAGAGGVTTELRAGDHLPAPGAATHVRFPSGEEYPVDGTRTVRATGEAGFYTFLMEDSTVSVVALNPPSGESFLTRLSEARRSEVLGEDVVEVDQAGGWDRAVFRTRQGPELWWAFLLAAMALLGVESLMATSGRRESRAARVAVPPAAAPHAVE